jgi:hypothetical protein
MPDDYYLPHVFNDLHFDLAERAGFEPVSIRYRSIPSLSLAVHMPAVGKGALPMRGPLITRRRGGLLEIRERDVLFTTVLFARRNAH